MRERRLSTVCPVGEAAARPGSRLPTGSPPGGAGPGAGTRGAFSKPARWLRALTGLERSPPGRTAVRRRRAPPDRNAQPCPLATRLGTALVGSVLLAQAATAADLRAPVPAVGFRATCEDLGTLCFADACGGDQIDAAERCRARCPSAAILSVVPDACPRPDAAQTTVLRRRG